MFYVCMKLYCWFFHFLLLSFNGYFPNLFLPKVPLSSNITARISQPIKGIADIKTNHPDLFISCNRLTLTDSAGIKNMRTKTPDIPE